MSLKGQQLTFEGLGRLLPTKDILGNLERGGPFSCCHVGVLLSATGNTQSKQQSGEMWDPLPIIGTVYHDQ